MSLGPENLSALKLIDNFRQIGQHQRFWSIFSIFNFKWCKLVALRENKFYQTFKCVSVAHSRLVWKSSLGLNHLIQNSVQQDCFPDLYSPTSPVSLFFPQTFSKNPAAKNFLIFPTETVSPPPLRTPHAPPATPLPPPPLITFTSSTIKVDTPSTPSKFPLHQRAIFL